MPVRALDNKSVRELFEQSPQLKNAQYSVYAKYVGGKDIISVNPSLRLSPASILKLYTTAAALDILGPDYTFETRVYYSGKKDGGHIDGNVYIRGGGDPSLGSQRLAGVLGADALMDVWANTFKSLGIKRVQGDICADNTLFAGVLLPWRTSFQNIGNYFAAPADALSLRDNTYEIYFNPSQSDGQLATVLKTVPEIKGFDIKSYVSYSKDINSDDAYANFVPAKREIEIYGSLPLSDKPLRILAAIPSPAQFTAEYFKDKLAQNEIKVKGEAKLCAPQSYDDATLVLSYKSPALSQIIKYTNKRSFNLYAESILRSISAARGGAGKSGDGIEQIKNFLTRLGIDNGDYDVFDGSGLSRDDIITCSATVGLLEAVLKQPYKDAFLDSLPVAGDDEDMGNMSKHLVLSSAANNALVKTGSLDRARSHAGYVKDAKGRQIVFCIISNNFAGSIKDIDAVHEQIINDLADIGLNQKPTKRKPRKH